MADASTAVIVFVLEELVGDDFDAMNFLREWNEGNFEYLRRVYPEAPEAIYISADPLYKKGK